MSAPINYEAREVLSRSRPHGVWWRVYFCDKHSTTLAGSQGGQSEQPEGAPRGSSQRAARKQLQSCHGASQSSSRPAREQPGSSCRAAREQPESSPEQPEVLFTADVRRDVRYIYICVFKEKMAHVRQDVRYIYICDFLRFLLPDVRRDMRYIYICGFLSLIIFLHEMPHGVWWRHGILVI